MSGALGFVAATRGHNLSSPGSGGQKACTSGSYRTSINKETVLNQLYPQGSAQRE